MVTVLSLTLRVVVEYLGEKYSSGLGFSRFKDGHDGNIGRTAPIPLLAPVTKTVFPMRRVALKMDIWSIT